MRKEPTMKKILQLFFTIITFFILSNSISWASVTISNMNINPSGVIQAGELITFSVTAIDNNGGDIYYKFYYCANYGTPEYDASPWVVMQDYSTSNICFGSFSEADDYIVVVRAVTDPNNEPTVLPIFGQVVSVGNGSQVNIDNLSISETGTINVSQNVTFTANASSSAGDAIYYKFYYCANYGTSEYDSSPWVVMQDYSTSNTCSYSFSEANDYIVVVRAVTDPNNEPASLPIIGGVITVSSDSPDSPDSPDPEETITCGAYVAPGAWKEFDCYNLAAIGKTTGDDPFTPSWRLIGGYWQWGRKGPDSSQWYDTNTANFAHGPNGPGSGDANEEVINGWDATDAPDGSWSDTSKKVNDPCPAGYRVPTKTQWDGVVDNNTISKVGTTWDNDDTNYSSARFFGDDLMLPAAGYRYSSSGSLYDRGTYGYYWSSTQYTSNSAWDLYFISSYAYTGSSLRRDGFSVRCVAE